MNVQRGGAAFDFSQGDRFQLFAVFFPNSGSTLIKNATRKPGIVESMIHAKKFL
jgi:hypothetical protein